MCAHVRDARSRSPRPARSTWPIAHGLRLAALVLAACACTSEPVERGPGAPARPVDSAPAAAPADVPAVPAGIDPLDDADTGPKRAEFAGAGIAYLDDVRVARHEGYDRVVFELLGEVPGYTVEYVEPPVLSDGAGEPVAVAGRHVVVVRMSPASGVDLTDPEPRIIYEGPPRVTGATSVVREVVRAGDFEAVSTWAVGLEDRVDFRVQALSEPSRLVVDFRNH